MLCATPNFWSSNKYWARSARIGLVTLRAKSESLIQISTFFLRFDLLCVLDMPLIGVAALHRMRACE